MKFFLFCVLLINYALGATNGEIFTNIYQKDIWGNGSGPGSKLENNLDYIDFINAFIKKHNIKSVVDLGCGDWQFSNKINWSEVDYIGLDCVEHVISRNQQIYGSSNIKFVLNDCAIEPLPKADLLICKDCLQHLDIKSVKKIVGQFKNFKYCLITNDIHDKKITNKDIKNGEYRCLDLTRKPFSLKGKKVFSWHCEDHGVIKATYLFLGAPNFFQTTGFYSLAVSVFVTMLACILWVFRKDRYHLVRLC